MRSADPAQQAERRESILDAALKAFARNGFHKTSMTDIAAIAGMSAGNLYRYYSSKEAIINALAERERRETNQILDALAEAPDLVDGLVALALATPRDGGSDKAVVDLEIAAEMARNKDLAGLFAEIEQEAMGRLAASITVAQHKRQVDPSVDPSSAARLLAAVFYALPSSEALTTAANREAFETEIRRLIEGYLHPRPG